MTGVGELYNKGLLVMWTMQKFKCSKQKARVAVEKFIANENKRIPDVQEIIDEVLTRDI